VTLLIGAVAHDPAVVPLWTAFREWFRAHGLPFDYVLYSHYERQVEDLIDARIHAAWNSSLAWVRARRLAAARGIGLRPVAMRDTDRDLTSVVVTRSDSPYRSVADLLGQTVAVGAVDSPQATLLPLAQLRHCGLRPGEDLEVRRFDLGVGLHGDDIGGEWDAARALAHGEVAAACMADASRLLFDAAGDMVACGGGVLTGGAGTEAAGSGGGAAGVAAGVGGGRAISAGTRPLASTDPYDGCVVTVVDTAPPALVERFTDLLLSMSHDDPDTRELLDLAGLTSWEPGRTSGYAALEAAVDMAGFYGPGGEITATDYHP
jgi:phosphonate transport system substrate-binding protein